MLPTGGRSSLFKQSLRWTRKYRFRFAVDGLMLKCVMTSDGVAQHALPFRFILGTRFYPDLPMRATFPLLVDTDFPMLKRQRPDTLQVNLGYTCNQSCVHCHVNAGPNRTEQMDRDTIERVLDVLRAGGISTLDLTGGAPEMNPHFRTLVPNVPLPRWRSTLSSR